MKGRFLNKVMHGRLRWFHRGLAVIATLSTLFTYSGARDVFGAETLDDRALAAALAMASGIMIFLIWRSLFESASGETSIIQRAASLLKTLIGALAIVAASTWLMVANFAQNKANEVQMLKGVSEAESYTAAAYDRAVEFSALSPQIRALAAELTRWADLELTEGVSTGISGPGAVVSALSGAGAKLVNLSHMIDAAHETIESERQEATDRLAAMRAAAGGSTAAEVRWQDFRAHEAAWRVAVAHIDSDQVLPAIVAGLKAASRDLGAVVVLSQDEAVAAKQRAALTKYRTHVAQQAAPIIAQSGHRMAGDGTAAPVIERIGVAIAVLTYWQEFSVFWLLGLGIDFAAPLIMLISIHVATATTTPRELFVARVRDTTVADLAAAKMAEQMLKRVGLDQQSGNIINDALIGRNPHTEGGLEDD